MIIAEANPAKGRLCIIVPMGKYNAVFRYDDAYSEINATEIDAVATVLKLKYPKLFQVVYEVENGTA
jgi:hypothetical protein